MTEIAGEIRSERRGGAAWITIHRPDRLNSFAGSMRDELAEAIEAAAADPTVRVVAITGAGRGFSAGADVQVMSGLVARDDSEAFASLVDAGIRVIRALRAAPQPVIAVVNGVAVGAGASLLAACDIRVASESASVGFTFNRIGLHPDWGATWFLPRLVGRGHATELILSARILKAAEAERIGLFERLLNAEDFPAAANEYVAALAAKPGLALREAKLSLSAADRSGLDAALTREREAQLACFGSDDVKEGLAAFFEKRQPRF